MMLTIEPHPLLDLHAFVTEFPDTLGQITSSPELLGLLSLDTPAPFQSSDAIRRAIRDLLRHGGFKPTGRNKPASEYLVKVATEYTLTSINLAVDACNAVSLHSGLPITVIDLDRAQAPFHVAIASLGMEYIFNPSGQSIDLAGLLCLFDSAGPCGNAVKDSQRTKTASDTRRTLSLIWGSIELSGRAAETEMWYRAILTDHGAKTKPF
ncbi:MAG: hypothetical protein JW829_12400 [Pirellulales bacterium]|nr:hypothetical protein [Pirellulales bacterium]